jgi:hypothetical protein
MEEDLPQSNTVLVSGYSAAPKGTSMFEEFKHAGVVLEIDVDTHRIVAVDATFVTELARSFFARLVIGYDVTQGAGQLERNIAARLHTPSRDALIVALRAAIQRYIQIRSSSLVDTNRAA